MGMLDGKVALVTGAGRGLGREEALLLAKEGAKVIVNDLGGHHDGTGTGKIADDVVAEIVKNGGEAIANYDSVTDFEKTKGMIDQAIAKWGKLDIVVNNAGFLRDSMIFNMKESDWDLIMAVHLKGTFNLTHHFGAWLRKEIKAGTRTEKGRIINTSSDSGLFGNPGQSNYGAAKSGIAMFSIIVSRELRKYANVNCVVPSAATRMTIDAMPEKHPLREMMAKGANKSGLKVYDAANFAPLVAYLASDASEKVNGQVFRGVGDAVWIYQPWQIVGEINNEGKAFTTADLAAKFDKLMESAPKPANPGDAYGAMFGR